MTLLPGNTEECRNTIATYLEWLAKGHRQESRFKTARVLDDAAEEIRRAVILTPEGKLPHQR